MKELMMVNKYMFTGLTIALNYLIEKNFTVSHNISLGKDDMMAMGNEEEPEKAGYQVHAQYSGKDYVMNGVFSLSGLAQSVFHYKKGGFFLAVSAQAVNDVFGFDIDASYTLNDSLLETRIQSKEMGVAFTQAVTRNIDVGVEYMVGNGYVYNKLILRQKDKEAKTKKTLTLTKGSNKNEMRLYYSKKVTKAVEFLSAYRMTRKKSYNSNWYFGYMNKSQTMMLKSLVDGTGTISTLLELPFSQYSSATVCANLNYRLNTYDFGFGVNIAI